jgi:HlyD family secretion protein
LSVSQRALGGVSAPLMSRERVIAIALGLVALVLAFLIAHDVLFPAAPAAGSAQTRTVSRGTVRSAVSGTGTLVPASQQNLTFGVAGTLIEVDVKVGDQVKQGQVLAKLDQTTFQNALSQANNNVTTAQATLNNTLNGNSITQGQHSLDNAKQSLSDAQASVNLVNQQDANAVANDQNQLSIDQNALNLAHQQNDANVSAAQLALDNATSKYTADGCWSIPSPPPGSTCASDKAAKDAAAANLAQAQAPITAAQNAVNADQNKLSQDQTKQATDQLNGQKTINSATAAVTTAQDMLNSQTIQRPNTIASQQAAVANAQLAVQTAQKNLDQTTLTAPVDGTVLSITGQAGESVGATAAATAKAPGSDAPQPTASGATSGTSSSGGTGATGGATASSFIVLGNLTGLQVIAPFAEADAARLAANQQATITFDAVPNLSVPAHLLAVGAAASVIQNVTNYYATLVIDQIDARLKSGMTANASVIVQQANNVLMVPNTVISRLGGTAFVTLLGRDGKTQTRTQVQTGVAGDQSTEIVSGLNEGDKVVVPQLRTTTTPGGVRGPGGGGGGAVKIG